MRNHARRTGKKKPKSKPRSYLIHLRNLDLIDDSDREFVRSSELANWLKIGRTSIYRLENQGTFPKRVQLTNFSTAWRIKEVNEWINKQNQYAINHKENTIKIKELSSKIGIHRTTIYRLEKAGEFPKREKFKDHTIGWNINDINKWMDQRTTEINKDKVIFINNKK